MIKVAVTGAAGRLIALATGTFYIQGGAAG